MQKKKVRTTLVEYIVPQDLDQIDYPNAFEIPKKAKDITMNDIETYFPLFGPYIFRFAYKDVSNKISFVDWNRQDPKTAVPRDQGQILIKATRVSQQNPQVKYRQMDQYTHQGVYYNEHQNMMDYDLQGYNYDSD